MGEVAHFLSTFVQFCITVSEFANDPVIVADAEHEELAVRVDVVLIGPLPMNWPGLA